MTFPSVALSKALDKADRAMEENGATTQVRLREGAQFTVKMTQGRALPEDMTEGMTQDVFRMRVMANRWDAASPGRAPQKGDELEAFGRKHGVMKVYRRGLADTLVMYVLVVKG